MKKPGTIAVKLRPNAEKWIRFGHPWVFSDSIEKIDETAQTGDVCILFGHRSNKLYAVGLFDKNSPVQIKILERGPLRVDQAFFLERFHRAWELRQPLIRNSVTGYRWIYGENDYLPGMVVDVYDQVAVLKLYSSMWFPYLEEIKSALLQVDSVEIIVLRMSRLVQKDNENEWADGTVLRGSLPDEEVVFSEYGVRFVANVVRGHKTGFFLDHRHNRKKIGELAAGKAVLDVFAYAGGFSIHALTGGAREVTAVDISEPALKAARKNASLNSFDGQLITQTGDAFAIMKDLIRQNKKYDIVVIDPPSFAKQQSEVAVALKKYEELATLGAQITAKKGILFLASCSSRVSKEDFLATHQKAFATIGHSYIIWETTRHDLDHPMILEELNYLKGAYYRL